MAYDDSCPNCGQEDTWRQESGEYALLGTHGGVLELHTDKPATHAVVVKVTTCSNCRFVKLFEA